MANMYDVSGLTYQPSTNMDWFTKAIFGGKLIEKGKITPVIGIKNNTLINLLDIDDNILQADDQKCSWTPQQIAKLSEKELEVKNYKINLEQCIDELEAKRTAWMLSPGARNQELPTSLQEATLLLLAEKLSGEIEKKLFAGDSAVNPSDFDGMTKVLKNSTEAVKVTGVALTKENVLGEFDKMIAALPEDVMLQGLENEGLNIFVSYTTLLKIKMALGGIYNGAVVAEPNAVVESGIIRYMGIEVVPVKGILSNDMILANTKNLLLGTDLVSDLEEIRLGQFAAPNDNKIFIDGRLRLGFTIPFEDEVVYYEGV